MAPARDRSNICRVSTETALDLGQVHRLSIEEYHRLVESGGFDEDSRVELIDAPRPYHPATAEVHAVASWSRPASTRSR